MRFLRQSLSGLFLLSLTLGLLAYAAYVVSSAVQARLSQEAPAPERRERVFAVNVVEARPGPVIPVLTAFGEVESRRRLELRAKTGGTLQRLADSFEEGGQVRAGQVLAEIDPADAQAAFDRAESDLRDAEAEVREAARGLDLARDELAAADEQAELQTRAFQRQSDLEARGVGTAAAMELAELSAAQARQALLTSRRALAQAEARVDQAANRLARSEIAKAEAQRGLDDTRLIARFSGVLADVSVLEGGLVSANERLATLIDPEALEVAFRVSTAQYARLLDADGALVAAPVEVVLDSFGTELRAAAVISRDSAAVGEGQTGRLIFARMRDPGGMKPGDFVTVRIEEPELEEAVRLPATALGPDGRVLVVNDEERLEAMDVMLLRRQGDDVLVRAQALDGRRVVTNRSPLLGEGIRVRVLEGGGTAKGTDGDAAMLELGEDRRAKLIAYVEASTTMPEDVKARLLEQLRQARVPAGTVERLERRMGG